MKKIISIVCVWASMSVCAFSAELWHVEPSFWWVGMHDEKLQIMVHGDKISESTPHISYPGIYLDEVVTVENPNYLFLYLTINPETESGDFDISFEKDSGVVATYKYELKARKKNSPERKGFGNEDIIYEIVPDRFANGDPSNDIVPECKETKLDRSDPYARHGGDLRGIIDHLPYLESMGFTALWLTPVTENDQDNQSYHGYASTDFYKIDPRYGNIDDYKELCDKASEHGIKIIMDMILNHCGSNHWWMKDMPCADWINYYPDYRITNHIRTTNQDPHASIEDTDLMHKGWFVPTMPDMNTTNRLLTDYLVQNSIWWIEYANLGGIRLDTYPYPDKEFKAMWCSRILKEYPNMNMVGEEWVFNPAIVSYWQRGKVNKDGYEGNLPSLFDFPMRKAVIDSLNGDTDSENDPMMPIYDMLANDFQYADSNNLVVFLGNHDIPRYYMELHQNIDLAKNAMVWLMTTRGIPEFYYGDEILMTHEESNDHGHIRKDFPGGWENDKINAFTDTLLSNKQKAFKSFIKKLTEWRRNKSVIHNGTLTHFAPENGIYVYFRKDSNETIMVILNRNPNPCTLNVKRFRSMLGEHKTAKDILSGTHINLDEIISLSPATPMILELQ